MTGHGRRGASLLELLAVMAASAVATTVGMGLVHRTLRMQSHTRYDLEHDHTALAFGRQLRADVREAVDAVDDDPTALLVLRSAVGGTVTYRVTPRGLQRQVETDDGGRRREDYELPRLRWRAVRDGRLVTLVGTGPEPGRRPLRIEVCGVLAAAKPTAAAADAPEEAAL
jgi:hypothetical protein